MIRRKSLLNVPVDLYQPDEFILRIESAIRSSGTKTIMAVNPEKIISARKDHELCCVLEGSDLLIPDGIGTALGIRLIHGISIQRTTGFLLMQRLLGLAEKRGYAVFFFGATKTVSDIALRKIKSKYPHLRVAGASHGYITEEENKNLVEKISRSNADILFVALGSPKQEKWISANKQKLGVKVCMGIGGSLDVISGRIRGAPTWVHKLGLEWLFRLMLEPSRLKRQMALPRYSFALLKKIIS